MNVSSLIRSTLVFDTVRTKTCFSPFKFPESSLLPGLFILEEPPNLEFPETLLDIVLHHLDCLVHH